MRFSAYLLFLALWTLLVYAPVAHWVWGGGWLAQLGALDFAGGTVVHVNAGAAALVAAVALGPRKDYAPFDRQRRYAGQLWTGGFVSSLPGRVYRLVSHNQTMQYRHLA